VVEWVSETLYVFLFLFNGDHHWPVVSRSMAVLGWLGAFFGENLCV
jgi:hypothetical protein